MSLAMADRTLILNPHQRKVIDLRLRGYGRRQIAHMLGIAPKTVRYHLDRARTANDLVDELDLLIARDRELRR